MQNFKVSIRKKEGNMCVINFDIISFNYSYIIPQQMNAFQVPVRMVDPVQISSTRMSAIVQMDLMASTVKMVY